MTSCCCLYCHTPLIDPANIRCKKCNIVFEEGVTFGQQIYGNRVREALILLFRLAGLQQPAGAVDET